MYSLPFLAELKYTYFIVDILLFRLWMKYLLLVFFGISSHDFRLDTAVYLD